jgi:hypothetical protein
MKDLVVKGRGAFINVARLRALAFADNDKTDNERALRVALQDALVLALLYKEGVAEESELE